MRLRALAATLAAALVLVVPAASAQTGGTEVVIDAATLTPANVRVPLHGRVTFLNRSGTLVHVEFEDRDGGHHTFQVPGRIFAEFHRPGTHLVVVHVGTGRVRALRGVVDVGYEPAYEPQPGECTDIAVQEACLER